MAGPSRSPQPTVYWDGNVVSVDGVVFECGLGGLSSPEAFHLRKPPHLARRYMELAAALDGGKVVELGIAEGGSAALFTLLARPDTLVALELESEPVEALDAFIAERQLSSVLRPKYGVDQSDAATLLAICREEFGGGSVDLVMDDASHLLGRTRASFETLFPLLRPGGRYLIEDWQWQQRRADALESALARALADPDSADHDRASGSIEAAIQDGGGRAAEDEPLPRLAVELLLAVASDSKAIADIRVDPAWITVTRGDAVIEAESFQLTDQYTDHLGLLGQVPDRSQG